MEEVDKECLMITMGVSGWMLLVVLTHLGVPDKGLLNSGVCACVCV